MLLLSVFVSITASATTTYQFSIQPIIAAGTITDTTRLDLDSQFVTAIFAQGSIGVNVLPAIYDPTVPSDVTNFFAYNFDTHGRTDLLPVWFVHSIIGGVRGESIGTNIWVSDVRVNDTVAHELAHVLTAFNAVWEPDPQDPSHSLDPYNLLASGSIRYTPSALSDVGRIDQLQPVQITAMAQPGGHLTAFDAPVPEPSQSGVCLVAVGVLVLRFRKPRKIS